MKGLAWYIIFLVVMIGIIVAGALIVLWDVISRYPQEANKISCQLKYVNYCFRWSVRKKDPGDWNKVEPKECEKLEINKPSESECKKMFPF
jgi:hypothetical protein